jgi:hypothetical protein
MSTPSPNTESIGDDLIERAWFQRDPVTGNFVQAEPPQMFTHDQVVRMARSKAADAATIATLREAVEAVLHELHWVHEQLDLMPDDYLEALAKLHAALANTENGAGGSTNG